MDQDGGKGKGRGVVYEQGRRGGNSPELRAVGEEPVGAGLFLVSKICCYILPGIN